MGVLAGELKVIVRSLLRRPVYAAVVILSIGLSTAVNTALFTLLNSLLLRSLPAAQPDRLILLEKADERESNRRFSYPLFLDLRDQNRTLAGLSVFSASSQCTFRVSGERDSGERGTISVQLVSGTFFSVLGITPQQGRLLTPSDDVASGAHPYLVISDRFWRHRLAGQNVVGQTAVINETPMTIVGIAPAGFLGVETGVAPDAWAPVAMQQEVALLPPILQIREANWLQVIGRLKPGVSQNEAAADLDVILKHFNEAVAQAAATPADRRGLLHNSLKVLRGGSGSSATAEPYIKPLVLLLAAAGGILLVACLNLSMLVASRTASRMKEIAVRFAIGAPSARIIRFMMLESLILSVTGSAVGLIVARWVVAFLLRIVPQGQVPVALNVALDYRILAFGIAVSLLVTLLVGVAPVRSAMRADLTSMLKGDAVGLLSCKVIRRGTYGRFIVVSQVALSMVLLVGAGMFVRTLFNLNTAGLGFERDRVLAFEVTLPRAYDRAKRRVFIRDLTERLRALPQVSSASFGSPSILSQYESFVAVYAEGGVLPRDADIRSNSMSVMPGFLQAMHIQQVSGREFEEQDSAQAPKVAVLSESAALYYFGRPDVTGRYLRIERADSAPVQVVGVARDIRFKNVRDKSTRMVYLPWAQSPPGWADGFVVRTATDPKLLIPAIRSEARALESRASVDSPETFAQRLDQLLIRERMLAYFASAFGLLAVFVTSIGIFGVVSTTVAQQSREMAIRTALGAPPGSLPRLFVKRELYRAGIGALIGLALAAPALAEVRDLIYGISPYDPFVLWSSPAALVCLSALSAYLASRRASRVDPSIALRLE